MKISKKHEDVVQRYYEFLKELKLRLEYDAKLDLTALSSKHNISHSVTKIVVSNSIVSAYKVKNERGRRYRWNLNEVDLFHLAEHTSRSVREYHVNLRKNGKQEIIEQPQLNELFDTSTPKTPQEEVLNFMEQHELLGIEPNAEILIPKKRVRKSKEIVHTKTEESEHRISILWGLIKVEKIKK
jgi:hypothetical protein